MEDRKAEMPYVLQDTPGGPCGEVGGVTDMKVRAVFGQDILCFVSRMLWTQICPWIVLWDACGLAMVAFETRHGKEKMENEKKLESKLTAQSGQRMRLATAHFFYFACAACSAQKTHPSKSPKE